MERRHALFVAACAGTIAFALAFAYPAYDDVAVLWYYPLEHRWAHEIEPRGLAMDFFGRMLLAAMVATPVAGVTYAVRRRLGAASPRVLGLWAGWALTAVALVCLFYGWTLAVRRPVPAPLPPWYEPR